MVLVALLLLLIGTGARARQADDRRPRKKSDEKVKKFSLFSAFSHGIQYESTNFMDGNELFLIQSETIRSIARSESAIFVGRCADYILRDHPRIANVFISAPDEERVCPQNAVSLSPRHTNQSLCG